MLNPDYLHRIMRQDSLVGLEVVFLAGEQFGVSVRDESLLGDDGWIDDDGPDRYAEDRFNYRGWSKPGKLYCAKCWRAIVGVPRDIIARNWCDSCASHLYPADDDERMDFLGFYIYRDHVTRYTDLAVRHFASLIEGSERIYPDGGVEVGFHKDHIYSVRDAFEGNIAETVVASPANLRVLPSRTNISKGRRSEFTRGELMERYESFIRRHPEWLEIVKDSDENQETFVFEDDGLEM